MTQVVADITVDTKTAWHHVLIGNVQREKRTKSGTVWSFSPIENEAGVGAKLDDPMKTVLRCISRGPIGLIM